MFNRIKKYFSLVLWIASLLVVGFGIGHLMHAQVDTWYLALHRSALTPPNYVFPIAWTVLYCCIAIFGWILWSQLPFLRLHLLKSLYIGQLLLNWAWTPLFFGYHLIGAALACIISMDLLVGVMLYLSYSRMQKYALLMIPYLAWILFATYLNFYIWCYN